MSNVEEIFKRIKKIRNGEKVVCSHCGKGIMRPVGDCKTTHCFICDKCNVKLNID